MLIKTITIKTCDKIDKENEPTCINVFGIDGKSEESFAGSIVISFWRSGYLLNHELTVLDALLT